MKVGVDYASFRNAGGADFADRLRLVQLPACALTTPSVPTCRVQTPLASANDATHTTVSAQVQLPAASSKAVASQDAVPGKAAVTPDRVIVLGLAAGASGSNGDFTATPISPAGSWSAGGAAGDFNWSYPISVPAAAAGPTPVVSLGYSSSDVDGRTASTNNQFGPIGEGFTLSNSYISRSYADCADDPEGAIANDYDNCWAGQVVSMSLNGQSTTLIVDSNGVWHAQAENGDLIQYETGTSADTGNGTHDNGYWVVTTSDGTKYYFGKNKGPGWAAGDPTTNSAWTEPVYGAHPGDPCNSTAGFAQSSCSQAWQWNLDFVIDPHGNTAAYYYAPEVGYYGADNQTTPVAYDRAGYPTEIDYGMRDENGSVYGSTPPRKVVFGTALRCFGDATTCAFTSTNTTPWQDTPVDQICPSSGTCSNHSPTFYSEYLIDDISTEYYPAGSTTPVRVDDYALKQAFATAGDDELMLNSITRTGGPTGSAADISLPPVSFEYQLMDNRIPGYNSEPAMAHWRLTNIESETGEITAVTYSSSCTTAQIPSDPSQNTSECYPVKWTPEGIGSTNPILDYFNKYVVTQVADSNAQQQVINGNPQPLTPTQITNYVYPPGKVLWHYDDDQLVKPANRTYGQFRGYPEVDSYTGDTTHTSANGTLDQQTETKTFYYRGMDGDQLPGGGTRSATVSDTLGDTYTDNDAFADQVLETEILTGPDGSEVNATITTLAVTATTGSMAVSGLPTLYADMVAPSEVRVITDLATGGTEIKTTKTTYDAAGRAVLVDSSGSNIAESCTQTSYAGPTPNPNASPPTPSVWITQAVAETIAASGPCPASPGGIATANILGDTRTFYDGSGTLGAAPTTGEATTVSKATGALGGTSLTFHTQAATTYDAMGRVSTAADALGYATTVSYTPADGGIVTAESTTNVLNQVANSTYDPARGSVLSSTTVSGYLTSATYDALGRTTAVWKPGRSQTGGAAANDTYSYLVSQSVPNALTTNTLVDYSTGTAYLTSIAIQDGRGQTLQTQSTADGGGITVADAFYDSHGWQVAAWSKYYTSGNPSTTEVTAQQADFNAVSQTFFDTAGRAIQSKNFNGTILTSSAQMINGGDRATTIGHDPAGNVIGTPTTTVADVNGKTIETGQYTAPPVINGNVVMPASGSSMQTTTTTYNAAGQKAKVTDPVGDTWSYTYDLQGHQTKSVDPDTGTSTETYDADGNIASSTDANGTELNFVYDQLGRKTAEYTGSTTQGSGTKIATWIYDTLVAGKIYYETSTNPATGLTYQTGVTGYDAEGDIAGTWVTIPKSGATAGLGGTYTSNYAFTTTGLMTNDAPATAGGLPSEGIDYTYDQYGNVQTEGLHAYDVYADGASYSPYGQLTQIKLGTGPSAGALSYTYDPQTGQPTEDNLSVTAAVPQIDDTTYTYNAARQLVSTTDTEGGSGGGAPVETQCYTYDILNRLTAAWSATDNCAANPFTSKSSATIGGPQPYAQAWTFDALGDHKTQTDMPAAGSAAGITTTSYTYATPGHAHALTSISSSNTVTGTGAGTTFGYNNDGQSKSRASGAETLTWTPAGQLQSDANASTNSSFLYDADGNRLIETDTSTNTETLFLPGEQITYNTGNGVKTGIRYYSFCGVTIAESTGTAGTLYWLESNAQNTASVAVSAFSNTHVTRRLLTPYGQTAAGSTAWIDPRSFLGDQQTSTGLVDVGARSYDPAIGAFISIDPELDTANPQSMTGYEYADDNPVGESDPTGLDPGEYGTGVGGSAPDCGVGCDVGEFNGNGPTSNGCVVSATDYCTDTGSQLLKDAIAREKRHETALKNFLIELKGCQNIGYGGLAGCETGSITSYMIMDGDMSMGEMWAELLGGLPLALLGGGEGGDDEDPEDDPVEGKSMQSLETEFAELIGKDYGQSIDAAVSRLISETDGEVKADTATLGCLTGGQSFTAGTLVLTASGKTVPIAALSVGDKVQAFDTVAGKKTLETVQAVLVNHDTDLYDLTVQTPHGKQTIHTTGNHPIWDPTDHAWVDAGSLTVGEHVLAADGATVTVAGGTTPKASQGWMWDLTVETDHDFYVVTGGVSVLVHNSCGPSTIVLGVDGDNLTELAGDYRFNGDPGSAVSFHDYSDGFGGPGPAGDYTDFFNHFRAALKPDSGTKLVFDLRDVEGGSQGAREWADSMTASDLASNPSSEFTGWELGQIKAAPKSVRDNITWVGGPNPFADLP